MGFKCIHQCGSSHPHTPGEQGFTRRQKNSELHLPVNKYRDVVAKHSRGDKHDACYESQEATILKKLISSDVLRTEEERGFQGDLISALACLCVLTTKYYTKIGWLS